jgi:hypothetical protein
MVHQPSTEPGAQVWHSADKAKWREVRFPGKSATTYTPVNLDGQAWLRADAQSSVSMLRQKIDPNLGPYSRIRFSLVVEQPLMTADVARRLDAGGRHVVTQQPLGFLGGEGRHRHVHAAIDPALAPTQQGGLIDGARSYGAAPHQTRE